MLAMAEVKVSAAVTLSVALESAVKDAAVESVGLDVSCWVSIFFGKRGIWGREMGRTDDGGVLGHVCEELVDDGEGGGSIRGGLTLDQDWSGEG